MTKRSSIRSLCLAVACQLAALPLAAAPPAPPAPPAPIAPPAQPDGGRLYIEHQGPPGGPALPFSDAVMTGDTLHVAGHLGIDAVTGKTPPDPSAEARVVMDAVKATVERAGLHMDDLASVTVYCTDLPRVRRGRLRAEGPAHEPP